MLKTTIKLLSNWIIDLASETKKMLLLLTVCWMYKGYDVLLSPLVHLSSNN